MHPNLTIGIRQGVLIVIASRKAARQSRPETGLRHFVRSDGG
jgi:hypothetical protein